MINYEELINAAYQIKGHSEHIVCILNGNSSSIGEKLYSGTLASRVATGQIINSIETVSSLAKESYESVLELCGVLATFIPQQYQDAENAISGKFEDFTRKMPVNAISNNGEGIYN